MNEQNQQILWSVRDFFSKGLALSFFVTIFLGYVRPGSSQTAIGGNTPDVSAMLDVQSTTKGVLFPNLTTAQRNAIVSPATSLMIYNQTTECWEINFGTPANPYWGAVQCKAASVTALLYGSAVVNGTLYENLPASGVSISLPYTGGNGGGYSELTISSTGVTGLTATLSAGTLVNGSGNILFAITGTAASTGTASFAVNFGGQTCTLTLTVQVLGTITKLTLSSATLTGTLYANQSASGVSVSVPYTGGNGGSHPGQTVTSTGVTGLTATLTAGTFASGAGNLTYTITGVPNNSGTAIFALNIGGQTGALPVNVLLLGTISGLSCATSTLTGGLFANQPASGVSVSVPYTGGNGGVHQGQTVTSTGVSGLTATLTAGTFASGSGSLTYVISGTPAGLGIASFELNIGGQSCTLSKSVQTLGTISALTCTSAVITGKIFPNQDASMVSASLPYTGGNGGGYAAQSIASTGVTGLTATLAAGNFMIGSGNLVYAISGTASASGIASFMLSIGGQSCTLEMKVGCGALVASGQWLAFDCFNLGVTNLSANPLQPGWELIGNYYQWGRNPTCFGLATGNPCSTPVQGAAGPSGIGPTQANEGTISGWDSQPASSTAWSSSSPPCPTGFRIPSKSEWDGVIANNNWTFVGTWSSSPTNYSTGYSIGSDLFLPAAGFRDNFNGELKQRGNFMYYWSSTHDAAPSVNAFALEGTSSGSKNTFALSLTHGMTVRCVK